MTVELGQPALGQLRGAGGIDLAQEFSGQVGGADLAGGIADTQSLFDAFPAGLGESNGLPLAPMAPRLAASIAEGVLLDPATHLVEGGVGEPDGMEVIQHLAGLWQAFVACGFFWQ